MILESFVNGNKIKYFTFTVTDPCTDNSGDPLRVIFRCTRWRYVWGRVLSVRETLSTGASPGIRKPDERFMGSKTLRPHFLG